MPSRWVCVLIVVGWLAATGWLVWREFAPMWAGSTPPPFAIDLVDEASGEVRWTVSRVEVRNGVEIAEDIGRLTTRVRYVPAEDVYVMSSEVNELKLPGPPLIGKILVSKLITDTRVDREGEFRGINVRGTLRVDSLGVSADGSLVGTVREQAGKLWLDARLKAGFLGGNDFDQTFDPVEVRRGTALNPMQPLNRLPGLSPGREWDQSLVSPLDGLLDAVPGFAGQGKPKSMRAKVLSETQLLSVNGKRQDCLVVEYTGDGMTARTWVRATDGVVLRQEAGSAVGRLRLQRFSVAE